MSKRPQRAGPDVLGGLLWPLKMVLSLAITVFHTLLSPILQQIMLPILGVVLAVGLGILVLKFGLPYLLFNVISLLQLPFRILWRLYQGDLHLGDLNIRNALVTIHTNMPSRLAIVGGLCQVATIPGLCTVGLLERMKSVQEADRAIVARKLQKEAQDALDVFDSVIKLGTGGVDGGLHHTKVLAAESNSVFSWTIREFDRLFHLLSDDNLSLSPRELEQRLHSVMIRIQANLDNLYHITERTIPKAEAGSALGGRIMESVSWEVDRLEKGIKAEPGWKHSWEQAQRFLRGESEPSKLDILHNDLALSKLTVQNLQDLRLNLEIVRKHLRNHRNEIGLFSSGLMGFHLGFPSKEDTEPGTAAKVELNLLEEIVSEMKGALAATRQHRKGQQSDGPLEIDSTSG
ncbi:hypothetical protein QFC22_002351 [Naganishia vaughanmartiniae]|uniref:Uncharacterized protein n=1 Tax=Naganishia vaughanmartiniae TaxID=1424756 RepID=A0ACC2XDQ7_9TREE|nr:hypothetical protein QFC22_002351 [Naganishia vaughanmartiniae]